jgi:hypothetical protein
VAAAAGNNKGQRKVLWHAISIVVIVLASLLLFYKHFLTRGMLMHVDMTFPTTIERNLVLYNHTWWQYGSVQNIWNIQRIFWAYPLLGLSKLLNLSTDRYLLALFISTFALAGVSMYALTFDSIKRFFKSETVSKYGIYVGAVFAALIFMYNPFSVSHLWPYFGYPGYAVLPLVFLLLMKTVDDPRIWKVVLLAVLISVAGTGPINVVWYWFMIVGYLLFYLIVKKFNRKSLAAAGKVVLPLAGLYALLNAAWVVPYARSQAINKPFTPVYHNQFSRSMLDMLSKSGTILNNVRFTAGWGLPVDPNPHGPLWIVLSFALPALAIVAFVVFKKKAIRDRTVLFWTIMFFVSVLLGTGTSFILARPYSWFVLKAPGISSLGWVFRAADRWLIYAALFYSLLLGLLVAWLLRDRDATRKALAVGAIVVVLVSFVPITLSYAKDVYNPTRIPKDYDKVTQALEKMDAGNRPVWIPFARDGFHYDWAPEKRIGPFDVYTSNPSLNNLQDIFSQDNYYYWLESVFSKTVLGPRDVLNKNLMLSDDLASKLFMPLSGNYIVLDSSVPRYSAGTALKSDHSLKSVLESGDLEVFKPDTSVEPLRATTRTVLITNFYDELALARKLEPAQFARLTFAGPESNIGPPFGGIGMDRYLEPFDLNSGFETVGPDGLPKGWNPAEPEARPGEPSTPPMFKTPDTGLKPQISVDEGTKAGGRRSLKIVNPSHTDLNFRSVFGPTAPVVTGDIYKVKTWVKYTNSEWTRVSVEGFKMETGEWVSLVNCPVVQSGTSGWKNTECSFYMPEGISMIRPALVAGWAKSPDRPATSWFDNIEISRVGDKFYEDLKQAPANPEVTWNRVSPEKYEVQVRDATEPFMLTFGEAYDPMWVVRLEDGKNVNPVRLCSTVNGFPLDRKGDYRLTVEYVPQDWFKQGLVVSLVSIFGCLLFLALVLLWKRKTSRRRNPTAGGGIEMNVRSGPMQNGSSRRSRGDTLKKTIPRSAQ